MKSIAAEGLVRERLASSLAGKDHVMYSVRLGWWLGVQKWGFQGAEGGRLQGRCLSFVLGEREREGRKIVGEEAAVCSGPAVM